jgi:small conductance mechanosensitive channel
MDELLDKLGDAAMHRLLPSLILLLVGAVLVKILLKIISKILSKSKMEATAQPLIKTIAKVALNVLLVLTVLSNLGVDVTGLVAITSVVSLALSLAMQDALANMIGGFTLLTTRPFVNGDYVEVAGQAGTVQAIGINYTKLSTPDNKIISIPNSAVVGAQVVNYTVSGTRRVEIKISASYDAPIETVKAALLRAAKHELMLEEPAPAAVLCAYGDHAMEYAVRFWTKTGDYWTVHNCVIERIQAEFAAAGIEMTYPHVNVHMVQ